MDMGGMDMDMGTGSCKVSMLWNWDTIDACFLAKSWHITSRGMFAGSCIGVICLVLILEFLRRVGREYDAFIVKRARLRAKFLSPSASTTGNGIGGVGAGGKSSPSSSNSNSSSALHQQQQSQSQNQDTKTTATPITTQPQTQTQTLGNENGSGIIRPTLIEQLIRALLHMLQFAVAYFIMLLAMYFNGYIIICIFIGAFLGAFIFSWEPLGLAENENDATAVTGCCG
ncbi:high-affinity Cu transporter CTR3 [Aspergillus glaucus CBS 516.65]|uniref:Copper transport protein n=1 Tax=Aspergillus glaucus CBS 516.65 TaxID=1160497 RepID=A0A1L9VSX0_ASPGL|nr:hypothetical protein ASPGLDRAFT_120193 [Aspergillus glaucus CBS 516.65]OJJ86996.1 hypothetical protein ASPGLDRAFT_120193 [Aspergillus glaucus CBS 516.65]